MLDLELETARRLALEASGLILSHYAGEIRAEEKLGADNKLEPVTAADRAASRIIVDGLAKAFPGDAILSEEEIGADLGWTQNARCWIVDPIDGTAGFIKHEDDFAIQIGLAEHGKPVVGVVHLPAFGITYEAARGQGTFVLENGTRRRVLVREVSEPHDMRVVLSRNHFSPRMNVLLEHFAFASNERRGSVGLKIGLIAAGECDVYIHLSDRTKLWDTCAPQIILEEAGGIVTDMFGEALVYDTPELSNLHGIIACGAAGHAKIVEGLHPLLVSLKKAQR
ncbi:MAG: 3'-phosphoadenosine 5'-phosphosulfate (PAPS) 3'-phosphatase [Acidobacteria bacterium OLB17]|nr:MAG: 3'-phosphoadenosine 5'-phosphosulfate (PAPS) 3'-phosphatase [Acidobacteria bacterium OLB17]MCZ2390139.1 3'(2'),5'-bisphosphate nucleotidase CysQ [Acidobacteriota bacterium]